MSQQIQIIDANTMIGMHPTHRVDLTVEHLVRDMDAYRVAAGVAVSTIGVFHNDILGNAAVMESSKGSNRILPAATINPKTFFGSSSDLSAIRQQGFRIFRFFPAEQGWAIDSPAFGVILKQLAPVKSPIMVDIDRPGDVGLVARMAVDYPAPIILCGVSLDTLSGAVAAMVDSSNLVIETHELRVPGALGLISERCGADRIVFGSGAPRVSAASSLQYIFSSVLSDEDKQKVLGGNIRRILEAA
jgi:predicted TIM-barrel fold metal-dependent hydrolase